MGRRFDTNCNGSLVVLGENSYRCRVGHAWTAESLLEARDDEIEGALWVALRSLQEKANLSRRMGVLSSRLRDVAPDAGERGAG